MNASQLVVVENINADGSDAGLSFGGSNPPPELYFKCSSVGEAHRLLDLIMKMRPSHEEQTTEKLSCSK